MIKLFNKINSLKNDEQEKRKCKWFWNFLRKFNRFSNEANKENTYYFAKEEIKNQINNVNKSGIRELKNISNKNRADDEKSRQQQRPQRTQQTGHRHQHLQLTTTLDNDDNDNDDLIGSLTRVVIKQLEQHSIDNNRMTSDLFEKQLSSARSIGLDECEPIYDVPPPSCRSLINLIDVTDEQAILPQKRRLLKESANQSVETNMACHLYYYHTSSPNLMSLATNTTRSIQKRDKNHVMVKEEEFGDESIYDTPKTN